MKFKIGHFTVLKNTGDARIEGKSVEILTDLSPQIVTGTNGTERMVMGYEVLFSDGSHMVVEPNSMANVTREMDRMVRWSDCAWQPKPQLVDAAVILRGMYMLQAALRGMQ